MSRRTLDRRLEEARALAQAAERAKSAFLASMNHELRTPLGAVTGFAELLHDERAGPLTERQRRYVRHILEGSRSLQGLIEQILDVARAASDWRALTLTDENLAELVRDAALLARPLASRRDAGIAVAGDETAPLRCDSRLVKQALFELLCVMVAHVAKGGTVTAKVTAPGEGRALKVELSGGRLASEEEGRLDEAFRVAGSGRWLSEGDDLATSLGLALLIVERHGGGVTSQDRSGLRVLAVELAPVPPPAD